MSGAKAIRYLSLAAKAGRIVTGGDDVEKAITRQRKRGLLILASDAAPNAAKRADALTASGRVTLYKTKYTKSELASAVGRGSSVALALVTDEGLAVAFTAAAANGMEQEERI